MIPSPTHSALEKTSKPIGMFDSGLGGLTVMNEIRKELPSENIVYFGDTARLPYGGKSRETIISYSIENAIFLIEKNIKVLVVACNTATSHALEKMNQIFKLPVIGVIDPGAEHAVEVSKNGIIAVLGTRGTIQSEAYQKAILKRSPKALVIPIECPLFVPFVEEGYIDHPATRMLVKEYLRPLKDQKVDTLLLGCTHYPLLKKIIQEEIGYHITIIDSATSCAKKVAELLHVDKLKNNTDSPFYDYFVSDDPQKFQRLGSSFLGTLIKNVQLS